MRAAARGARERVAMTEGTASPRLGVATTGGGPPRLQGALLILDVLLENFDGRPARGDEAVRRRPQDRARVGRAQVRELGPKTTRGHGLEVVHQVRGADARRHVEQRVQMVCLASALQERPIPRGREVQEDRVGTVQHRSGEDLPTVLRHQNQVVDETKNSVVVAVK